MTFEYETGSVILLIYPGNITISNSIFLSNIGYKGASIYYEEKSKIIFKFFE